METRASFASIFSSLSETFSQVLSKEAELFQVEMREKASFASRGLIRLILGAFFLLTGAMVLVVYAILGLSMVMPLWLATLLIAFVFLITGGIILAIGMGTMKTVNLKPERTINSVKDTVRAVREGWQV
jgi:formate/nitrite transporter FocA (FNT family)